MAGEKRWICVGAVIQIRFAFVGATLSGAAAMFTLALDNIALPVVVLPAAPTIKTVTVNKDNVQLRHQKHLSSIIHAVMASVRL
jgi:hypothetical protein